MEDIVHKTQELASLVGSLQQGDDNSDLCGIIAQLEAAVAKRTPSKVPLSSPPPEIKVECELAERAVTAEDSAQLAPHIEVDTKVERKTPSPTGAQCSTKYKSRRAKRKPTESYASTKSERRKRSVGRPSRFNAVPEKVSRSKLDGIDIEWVSHNPAEADTSPQDYCDAASFEEFADNADASNDEESFEEWFLSQHSSGSLSFNGSCKLCEVEFNKKRIRAEAGETLVMEPSAISAPKLPIYPHFTAFANHLKKVHMVTNENEALISTNRNEQGLPTESQASSSNESKDQPRISLQPTVEDAELLLQAAAAVCKPGQNAITTAPSSAATSTSTNSVMRFMACPYCEKRYTLHGTAKSCYDQLTFHMHRKHGEALPSHVIQYSCKQCSFQTLRRRDLTRHEYVVHTEHESRGVPCKVCGKCVLPTSMVFHMAAVHGAQDVPEQVKARTAKTSCDICGKQFRGEINLQRHIKCVHNKIKEQLCHLCSQSFFAKRELQLHMFATHKINMSNMRVFKCTVEGCGYETLARRHLTIHNSVHSDVKNFTCEHCGKAFKCKAALSQHIRIMHTKDMKYTCTKCSFTSHAKQYVQRHMVIHSDVKKHRCDVENCTYATHFIENLTKHKRKHVN